MRAWAAPPSERAEGRGRYGAQVGRVRREEGEDGDRDELCVCHHAAERHMLPSTRAVYQKV